MTGEYNATGDPRWSRSGLPTGSVYWKMGQSAPVVVVTEMDLAELDDAPRRRLSVALTWAQMAVELVLSVRAERCLTALLCQPPNNSSGAAFSGASRTGPPRL